MDAVALGMGFCVKGQSGRPEFYLWKGERIQRQTRRMERVKIEYM